MLRSHTHGWDLSDHAIVESFALKHEAATLSCHPMTRGSIHQWSIRVERDAKFTWLGITTAASRTTNTSFLSSSSSSRSLRHAAVESRDGDGTTTASAAAASTAGGLYVSLSSSMSCLNLTKQVEQSFILKSWVYGSNGSARHLAQTTPGSFSTYTEGCIVSFRLDLTEQHSGGVNGDCGGTLSARVRQENHHDDEATTDNGGGGAAVVGGEVVVVVEESTNHVSSASPWFQLFTNLNASLPSLQPDDEYDTENDDSNTERIGFVPTVFLKKPGKVQFLGFKPVDFE
jgi:hypothetical protein